MADNEYNILIDLDVSEDCNFIDVQNIIEIYELSSDIFLELAKKGFKEDNLRYDEFDPEMNFCHEWRIRFY